jgi:hypothetical protein
VLVRSTMRACSSTERKHCSIPRTFSLRRECTRRSKQSLSSLSMNAVCFQFGENASGYAPPSFNPASCLLDALLSRFNSKRIGFLKIGQRTSGKFASFKVKSSIEWSFMATVRNACRRRNTLEILPLVAQCDGGGKCIGSRDMVSRCLRLRSSQGHQNLPIQNR